MPRAQALSGMFLLLDVPQGRKFHAKSYELSANGRTADSGDGR